jgi:hypothetical protein
MIGALGLIFGMVGATVMLTTGCGIEPRPKTVFAMKCYSGERLVLEARVTNFAPGTSWKTDNTMWDVDKQMYHNVVNMACVFEPTGETR